MPAYSLIGGAGEQITDDEAYSLDQADLLAGATDPNGDPLELVSVSSTSAHGAKVSIGEDGRIHFDATTAAVDPGEIVTDTFEFTVSDIHGAITTATATVSVLGISGAVSSATIDAPPFSGMESELSLLFDRSGDDILLAEEDTVPMEAIVSEPIESGYVITSDPWLMKLESDAVVI